MSMNLSIAARPIFIAFAQRDCGCKAEDAAWEYDNMLSVGGRPVLRDFYVHCSRVGAPFALSRAGRIDLHMTFENARAHAWFALNDFHEQQP